MSTEEDKTSVATVTVSQPRPARLSLSQHMTAIGSRLSQALSRDETGTFTDKPNTPTDTERRSVSRGRDVYQSSGRGGIGNIRQSSVSRDARPSDGPDDFSPTRGREPAVHPDRVYSVGRGGAGNIRSPSRDALKSQPAEDEYQAKLVRDHAEANPVHSSGRGGAGNISGSRSRSRGPVNMMLSSGRGGAGNIHPGTFKPDALDEEERMQHAHAHPDGIHSTGRGGSANLTSIHGPDVERVAHHLGDYESSGRGGAGNIRSRSGSREPGVRAPSKDKEKHGIAAIFDKFSHPHPHPHPHRLPHQHAHVPDQPPNEGANDVQ